MTATMRMVKDLGYSVVLRDQRFCIEPIPTYDDEVLHLVGALKEELIKAQALMKNITDWCGSDRKKWGGCATWCVTIMNSLMGARSGVLCLRGLVIKHRIGMVCIGPVRLMFLSLAGCLTKLVS